MSSLNSAARELRHRADFHARNGFQDEADQDSATADLLDSIADAWEREPRWGLAYITPEMVKNAETLVAVILRGE